MPDLMHSFWLVVVVAGVTAAIRFLPFLLFRKKVPKTILELAALLPPAIMGMLVIYCLRNTDFASPSHGIPELVCVALVAALQKWKHNTLLSILTGTLLYMAFVQLIFI